MHLLVDHKKNQHMKVVDRHRDYDRIDEMCRWVENFLNQNEMLLVINGPVIK